MAIYHLSAKVIGRSGGRSSVAAAAYRSAGRLRDERQGIEHDYTRKGGVVHTEIRAPENAPEWMHDRDDLWNAVEAVEKRKDAQLAREIEVALPRELDHEQRLELIHSFVDREFVSQGMIADVAVHVGVARDGQEQPHAHIMLTMRELTGDGFGKKERAWNPPDVLEGWREAWARETNNALERLGVDDRVDHRTLEAQRIDAEQAMQRASEDGQIDLALEQEKKVINLDREPEPKIGSAAHALEKRGRKTERGEMFREVVNRNREKQELGWRQLELKLELAERGRAFVETAREQIDALWARAEAAMERIRQRFGIGNEQGEAEAKTREDGDRSKETAERSEVSGDERARRDAILGRGTGAKGPDTRDIDNERKVATRSEQERRDAVLGKSQDKSDQGREQGRDQLQDDQNRILGKSRKSLISRKNDRDDGRGR